MITQPNAERIISKQTNLFADLIYSSISLAIREARHANERLIERNSQHLRRAKTVARQNAMTDAMIVLEKSIGAPHKPICANAFLKLPVHYVDGVIELRDERGVAPRSRARFNFVRSVTFVRFARSFARSLARARAGVHASTHILPQQKPGGPSTFDQ